MKFVKRFLPLLAIVALVLASCATQAGHVPKGAETPPSVAESEPQQPQVQPEAEVEKPSVEKSELQSLFEQANDLKDEAIKFGLDSILSDKFQEANKKTRYCIRKIQGPRRSTSSIRWSKGISSKGRTCRSRFDMGRAHSGRQSDMPRNGQNGEKWSRTDALHSYGCRCANDGLCPV